MKKKVEQLIALIASTENEDLVDKMICLAIQYGYNIEETEENETEIA